METHRRLTTLLLLERHRRHRRHGGGPRSAPTTDPAGTTYASDSFNRADGAIGTADLGGAWSDPAGVFRVLSNRARVTNAASLRLATLDSSQGGTYVQAADGWVRITAPVLGANGLALRVSDASNLLYLKLTAADATLYRMTGGILTALGSVAEAPAVGAVVEVHLSGSAIDVYYAGLLKFSAAETQGQTAALHGLIFQDTTSRLDTYSHKNF